MRKRVMGQGKEGKDTMNGAKESEATEYAKDRMNDANKAERSTEHQRAKGRMGEREIGQETEMYESKPEEVQEIV